MLTGVLSMGLRTLVGRSYRTINPTMTMVGVCGAIGNLIINRDTLQGNKQDKVSDRKSTKKKDKN